MVGREIKQVFHKEEAEIGDVILSVKKLTRRGKFENISFEVRKGEITRAFLPLQLVCGAAKSLFYAHKPYCVNNGFREALQRILSPQKSVIFLYDVYARNDSCRETNAIIKFE